MTRLHTLMIHPNLLLGELVFSVEWLAKSHLVIIVALGNDKDEAVRDLVSANNPFSTYIEGSRNLFIITDQRSSVNILNFT